MNTIHTSLGAVARRARPLAIVLAVFATSAVSAAIVEGRSSAGHRYVAGGIGVEEVEAMRAQAAAYSLQLVTAAKSGAYLAGVQVRIAGPGSAVVFDSTIDAPWLLVDLPPGRYTVRVTHSGSTVERPVTIAPGKKEHLVVHFDVPVDREGLSQTTGAERWLPR
jgi:hypothetical protein